MNKESREVLKDKINELINSISSSQKEVDHARELKEQSILLFDTAAAKLESLKKFKDRLKEDLKDDAEAAAKEKTGA